MARAKNEMINEFSTQVAKTRKLIVNILIYIVTYRVFVYRKERESRFHPKILTIKLMGKFLINCVSS